MTHTTARSPRRASRNPPSTARIELRAQHEAAIEYWVERLPTASDERIAALADATVWFVQQWRTANDRPRLRLSVGDVVDRR